MKLILHSDFNRSTDLSTTVAYFDESDKPVYWDQLSASEVREFWNSAQLHRASYNPGEPGHHIGVTMLIMLQTAYPELIAGFKSGLDALSKRYP